MAQTVKNLPALQVTQEMRVRFLGEEDSLEEEWQPTPAFLPRKSHGQRSLVGYNPWDHKESDMTKVTNTFNAHALFKRDQTHLFLVIQ